MISKQLPRPKWNTTLKRWVLSVMIDGQRKQFTSQDKRNGKREVIERAEKWIVCRTRSDLKFGDVFELYVQDYIKKNGRNEQLEQIRSISRLFVLPRLSGVPLDKIRVSDLQAVINDARPHREGVEKLSRKYLSNIRGVIVSFCRWCLINDYMDKNPLGILYIHLQVIIKTPYFQGFSAFLLSFRFHFITKI